MPAIIGIAISLGVLVGAFAGLAVWCCKRRRPRSAVAAAAKPHAQDIPESPFVSTTKVSCTGTRSWRCMHATLSLVFCHAGMWQGMLLTGPQHTLQGLASIDSVLLPAKGARHGAPRRMGDSVTSAMSAPDTAASPPASAGAPPASSKGHERSPAVAEISGVDPAGSFQPTPLGTPRTGRASSHA